MQAPDSRRPAYAGLCLGHFCLGRLASAIDSGMAVALRIASGLAALLLYHVARPISSEGNYETVAGH